METERQQNWWQRFSSRMLDYRRVLHVGDPASTASLLSYAARDSGRDWRVLKLAKAPADKSRLSNLARKAARGATWEGKLAALKAKYRRIHLHQALALPHVRWALGDYVLHLHGTEIRSRLYEASHAATVEKAVRGASVVFYSTPDLVEHVGSIRDDALLVPVPVPTSRPTAPLPPGISGDYVFFPSRWEQVKGGQRQIEIARELRRSLPASVELIGLKWGPLASDASSVGVRLVPTMSHEAFRSVVAHARVCVGQFSGILGASELDSLALDVPLVAPLNKDWYGHLSDYNPPVLGGTTLDIDDSGLGAELVTQALDGDFPANTREWVITNHSAQSAFNRVLAGYRRAHWNGD